jgi:hypothetical protein
MALNPNSPLDAASLNSDTPSEIKPPWYDLKKPPGYTNYTTNTDSISGDSTTIISGTKKSYTTGNTYSEVHGDSISMTKGNSESHFWGEKSTYEHSTSVTYQYSGSATFQFAGTSAIKAGGDFALTFAPKISLDFTPYSFSMTTGKNFKYDAYKLDNLGPEVKVTNLRNEGSYLTKSLDTISYVGRYGRLATDVGIHTVQATASLISAAVRRDKYDAFFAVAHLFTYDADLYKFS